ncbi:MAG: hypothetical protein N2441_10560 [Rhodocyclaceae bacterium]|nr:hypothetical protein [Rhodocyclaceae bacterium]
MRLFALVLVLVNLLLFAWGQGYFGLAEGGREPARLDRQIAPERIRLVDPASLEETCLRVIAPADVVERLRKEAPAEWRLSPVQALSETAHWVIVPHLPNALAAERKKTEYLRLGAKEVEIVTPPSEHGPYALSLGIFRAQSGAQALVEELTKKGARTLTIIPKTLPASRAALEIRAPKSALGKLPAGLPESSESEACAP